MSLLIFTDDNCDLGWVSFGKFCYEFVFNIKNQTEAEADCNQKYAHLASIHSDDETIFMRKKLLQGMGMWIGGDRKGNSFQWLDWTEFSYTNWDLRQPDGLHSPANCLVMLSSGKWHDSSCGYKLAYVCKKPLIGN